MWQAPTRAWCGSGRRSGGAAGDGASRWDRAGRSPGQTRKHYERREHWRSARPWLSRPASREGQTTVKVSRSLERAAEEGHQRAALRRRVLAEIKSVLVRSDDAADQARQAGEAARPEGVATPEAGTP